MKKYLLFLLVLFIPYLLFGQEFSEKVTEFKGDESFHLDLKFSSSVFRDVSYYSISSKDSNSGLTQLFDVNSISLVPSYDNGKFQIFIPISYTFSHNGLLSPNKDISTLTGKFQFTIYGTYRFF